MASKAISFVELSTCTVELIASVLGKKKDGKEEQRTDALNRDLDLRTQDLIPTIDAPDQPPRAIEGTRTAEGVDEGGIRGKVTFDRRPLNRWRGLGERTDDLRNLSNCGCSEYDRSADGIFHSGMIWEFWSKRI